jgi:hypothetical protein
MLLQKCGPPLRAQCGQDFHQRTVPASNKVTVINITWGLLAGPLHPRLPSLASQTGQQSHNMRDMTARGQFDLVGHTLIRFDEFPVAEVAANNLITTSKNPEDSWTTALMEQIGEWRAVLRSTYIRWAMAINGLHVAAAKYEAESSPKKFTVTSLRTGKSGPSREVIAEYSFKEAAADHVKVQPMLCAHGFIDMYAGLEEMVFNMYRRYLTAHPDHLMDGPSYKDLRKLSRNAENSPEDKAAWERAISERLDKWQRKRLYDGLDKVLLAFFQIAGLQTPTGYTHTTVETWSESIAGVSLIRNLLIHGENRVPQELEDFSQKPHGLGFQFKAGELLRLSIVDLQILELFCDALLTAFNLSLMERARPELADAAKRFKSSSKDN